jgi:hypothetical protein
MAPRSHHCINGHQRNPIMVLSWSAIGKTPALATLAGAQAHPTAGWEIGWRLRPGDDDGPTARDPIPPEGRGLATRS